MTDKTIEERVEFLEGKLNEETEEQLQEFEAAVGALA